MCFSPWGCKELDTTYQLNSSNTKYLVGKNTKPKRKKGGPLGYGSSRVSDSLADFSFYISCILPTFLEHLCV